MFTRIFEILPLIDIFGVYPQLYINMNATTRSKLGGFVSLVIFGLCIYYFVNDLQAFSNNSNSQILTSTNVLSVNELLLKNESDSYVFDSKNFGIYFALVAVLSDGSVLFHNDLKKYLSQQFIYTDFNNAFTSVPLFDCPLKNTQMFLLQDFDENNNATSRARVCLDQALGMGLASDVPNGQVNQTIFTYQIYACENNTDNILQFVEAQIYLPQTGFDFNNPQNPRKRGFDGKHFKLGFQSVQQFLGTLIPVTLQTDVGLFSENYRTNSLDFNVEKIDYQTMTRDPKNPLLLNLDLMFGLNKNFYFRKNPKIYQILSNLGGIMSIMFLIGGVICKFYNFLIYKHRLINKSFENLENTGNTNEANKY